MFFFAQPKHIFAKKALFLLATHNIEIGVLEKKFKTVSDVSSTSRTLHAEQT
jgi:hypothetical protein